MGKLTAVQVRNLREPGRYSDGEGLILKFFGSGRGSWIVRVQADGKRRDIGLGTLAEVGLADRILLRNAFADFGVSVYGGLVAVWIAERDDGAYWDAEWRTARSPRAQHWLAQIAPRFDALFGDYDCLGHMSNGEEVYRKRAAA